MAPRSRLGAWLLCLAAAAAAAATTIAPPVEATGLPAGAAAYAPPRLYAPDCGSCGVARWGFVCLPSPGRCGGTAAAACAVRTPPTRRWWSTLAYDCVTVSADGDGATSRAYQATIGRVYNQTVEDMVAAVKTVTAPPGTFVPSVVGRIRPLGTFDNLADTLEYFYGMLTLEGITVEAADLTWFVAQPPYAAAAVSLRLRFAASNTTGRASHIGTWRFDDAGLVSGYDLEFAGLTEMLAGWGLDYSSAPFLAAVAVPTLCARIGERCSGENAAWPSVEDCVAALTALPPSRFEAGNNVACRQFHSSLTAFRPEVHCPHVSREGGGKCIDRPFDSFYDDGASVLGFPWESPAVRTGA